jgi:glycosyltransferase involved in cell wall biosynthesis
MAGPHCLVFEPDVSGHRLQHVRHLTDALLEIGCSVTLALQADCREHSEYQVHLQTLEPRVRLFARSDPYQSPSFVARRQRIGELKNTITAIEPDWVYVPYADGLTQIAAMECMIHGGGVFGRLPIEGQIMRGKYGYPQQSQLDALNSAANRWLTRRSAWRVTHVLDPLALRGLEPLPRGKSFRLIPEPVEPLPQLDRLQARAALGVPSDGRYLSFVGCAHRWKGIELLLAAFARARLADNDRLLFIGQVAKPMRELIDRECGELLRQGRIVLIDRYVSDFELDCGFLASDVVTVPHPRQIGSSGTLVRAVAARRPVLASDFGWVGWVSRVFNLGTTVNVNQMDSYVSAIGKSLEGSADFRASDAAERFCQYHTIANQKAHWVAEIGAERELPLGPLSERVDWNWVLESIDKKEAA